MTNHKNYSPELDLTKTIIRCPFAKCHTRLIKPKTNDKHTKPIQSITFLKPTADHPLTHNYEFIKVEDVWDFDNIGVSKEFTQEEGNDEVKIERLIICSDCERGPLGFACFEGESKDVKDLKYYLHLDSVAYELKE